MPNRMMQNEDIPVLTEWVTLPYAASRLGISRQYANKLAGDGYFDTLHRLGDVALVVKAEEVEQKAEARNKS